MAAVKSPPWAPHSLVPLSNGSLTLGVQRGQKPGKSLTAAAKRVTSSPVKSHITRHITGVASKAWQEEVLAAAGLIPELRYIANTTANAASRAWVYPVDAKETADATAKGDEAPEEEGAPPGAIDPEIVRRAALLLVLIGEVYVVELPVGRGRPKAGVADREVHILAPMDVAFQGDDTIRLWGKTNTSGVQGGRVYPLTGPGSAKVTRIHRPDVRNAEEPDSPARSALPIFRQILGLGMYTEATLDSRVASAGIIEYPIEATVTRPTGDEGSAEFPDVLTETMATGIEEPDSAARLVPILIGVPPGMGSTGERSALKWHISPASSLDSNIHTLLDDNIRRIAIGMDAPPEVLLGVSGASHFSAWSIESEFIRIQVAPLLTLIVDGLSIAFETDYTFDTGPLTVRPNKAVEAQALYDRDEIGGATLRAACGFTEDDAPDEKDVEARAVRLALAMLKDSPSLAGTLGFPAMIDQFRIGLGLAPKFADYYPGQEKAPLAGAEPRDGGDGEAPEGTRPKSDGSPSSDADGKPHDVPGTD